MTAVSLISRASDWRDDGARTVSVCAYVRAHIQHVE
jgi:hypothetical protein